MLVLVSGIPRAKSIGSLICLPNIISLGETPVKSELSYDKPSKAVVGTDPSLSDSGTHMLITWSEHFDRPAPPFHPTEGGLE